MRPDPGRAVHRCRRVRGGTGTTPVLAPTYVSSGVANKPTVQLSAVNLQVIDGTGATTKINGTGNIVIGYAENNGAHRTGSHNLIVGTRTAGPATAA